MVSAVQHPKHGQDTKYNHKIVAERAEPAYPGANFNAEGFCLVHQSVRLSDVKADGNYRIIRKLCPECGKTALPANDKKDPPGTRRNSFYSGSGGKGSGENGARRNSFFSGSGGNGPSSNPEARGSGDRQNVTIGDQTRVQVKSNKPHRREISPSPGFPDDAPQPIQSCPTCNRKCPCCLSRMDHKKNVGKEKSRHGKQRDSETLRINHDRMFTKFSYVPAKGMEKKKEERQRKRTSKTRE